MKLKLSLLLIFISIYSWSQIIDKTFTTNGTLTVPAGVTFIDAEARGGGGSGGGAKGAGLLLGRGAAGGGGGAFVFTELTVSPGEVLNIIVAGQTLGTTGANGTTGGSSTITGYEASFLAVGGSGGAANNLGGTPVGGTGGTVAASAGTIKRAGGNGQNGNSALLSLGLTSGAGGAGADFGGAGGAADESVILGNKPGNAGAAPGGGGSGAINSALGAPQIGGVGGAGELIVTYVCPRYNITTSTTATNVCAATSSTATVTLTSSIESLPVGNYVVTYNRSSPSASALTANMTVSTPGTGFFTATGLTTLGSSIITITKLTSETCSATIPNSNRNVTTLTVFPATVGGTVSGGTTINSGNTSALLTLSGHMGSVLNWQYAVSPFVAWSDIVTTSTTYISAILTETTQFRAVVQSGVCTVEHSAATTVTVNVAPAIALASSAIDFCTSDPFLTTILQYTGTTGSPTTYSIVWNSSPPNSLVAVTDAVLLVDPLILIRIPEGTATGTYIGTLTVKNASGSVSLGSTFSVTILEPTAFDIGIGKETYIETSSSPQYAKLNYTFTTGSPTEYAIEWDRGNSHIALPNQGPTPFSFTDEAGVVNTIKIPANTPMGGYRGRIILYKGNNCIVDTYAFFRIGVVPAQIVGLTSLTEKSNSPKDIISVTVLDKKINIDTYNQTIDKVFVYDVSGNLIYKKEGNLNSKVVIDNLRSNNQILVVKVVLDNNRIETKKVIY